MRRADVFSRSGDEGKEERVGMKRSRSTAAGRLERVVSRSEERRRRKRSVGERGSK